MAGHMWQPSEVIAASLLESYRDAFKTALAAGTRRNFIVPYDFVPSFFVPILYMSVSHTRRGWLYSARWLMLTLTIIFNLNLMTRASSTNIAMSYAAGMWGFWAIMQNFVLLIWTRPQFEAQRIQRRKRVLPPRKEPDDNGSASAIDVATTRDDTSMNPLRLGQDTPEEAIPHSFPRSEHAHASGHTSQNGHAGVTARYSTTRKHITAGHVRLAGLVAPGADLEKYEYYWQSFPEDGSFLDRFLWSLDLYSTFRASGWNWVVRVIPHPRLPSTRVSGEAVDMSSVPLQTSSGYRTYATQAAFLRSKLGSSLFAYLSLDFLKILMMRDPYFAYGTTFTPVLPDHLAWLPLWALTLFRHILFLWALYAILLWILSFIDLVGYYLISLLLPMRGELWQYSSAFGSIDVILDRGLAGFWGVWWHQTFRVPFAGPADYLLRNGYVAPRTLQAKAAGMFFAFAQSGFLHGCGSWSSIPDTKIWYPMMFFMLSGMGVVVQSAACVLLRSVIDRAPRALRRATNLVYVLLWLHVTVWPLAEDFTHLGVWLIEPVPFSPFRALEFGQTENDWYRIEKDALPHWVVGEHWWQSGLAL